MQALTLTLLAIIISLFVYVYVTMSKKLRLWMDKGVPHRKPLPFLGNIELSMVGKFNFVRYMEKLYNEFPNEKYFGAYIFTQPLLLVRDPELLERIFVKDFQHFTDHGSAVEDDKSTVLNMGLFNLGGNEWRALRHKLAPTFTSGKLKIMFDGLLPCGDELIQNLDDGNKECRDLRADVGTYAMDVAANVIFGIEIKETSLRKEYRHHSDNILSTSSFTLFKLMFVMMFPKLAYFLGYKILNQKAEWFFRNLIVQTFEQRKKSGIKRNDYVQLLLKLKEEGHIELKLRDPDDEYLHMEDSSVIENIELTDDLLVAQAFQFLTAGFDAFQNTMILLFFELAMNKEQQNKLRKEINEIINKNRGYTYKALKEMTYLDQCINESLRKYPGIPFLQRVCTKTYQLDDNVTLEEGTLVMISPAALQMDPKYFPDPEKFDPERFHPDATRQNCTYLAFGAGPRFCIGMRFAMMELKLGIAKVIENYSLTVNPKTKIPLEMNPSSFFTCPKAVYFDLTKIK